jgi:hypothetical protein
VTVRKKELPNWRKKVPFDEKKKGMHLERERESSGGLVLPLLEPTQIEKKF